MRYHLFYQQHLLAAVEENDADFPSFFGHYRLEPAAEAAELAHVRAYIDYSVRVSPLMEQDRFDDPAFSEEKAYIDLIESSDWSFVETESQQRILLLIPLFCTNGEIIWRLNPARQTDETV